MKIRKKFCKNYARCGHSVPPWNTDFCGECNARIVRAKRLNSNLGSGESKSHLKGRRKVLCERCKKSFYSHPFTQDKLCKNCRKESDANKLPN